jgi:hypothetical protein
MVTVLKNVWITQIDATYDDSNWVLSETMGYKAQAIYTYMTSGGQVLSVAQYHQNNLGFNTDAALIESSVDKGDYQGSMDAQGIMNITGNLF